MEGNKNLELVILPLNVFQKYFCDDWYKYVWRRRGKYAVDLVELSQIARCVLGSDESITGFVFRRIYHREGNEKKDLSPLLPIIQSSDNGEPANSKAHLRLHRSPLICFLHIELCTTCNAEGKNKR